MSTPTTNYNLIKPALSDSADITVINGNMDVIDTNMKAISNVANSALPSTSYTANDILTKLKTVDGAGSGLVADSATKLLTARTIGLGTAVASTATSFDGTGNITIPINSVSEAYLTWGGKSLSGSYAPIDSAMVPVLGANRLAFTDPSAITVEYSRDGGVTWVDYGTNDSNKINLLCGNTGTLQVGGGGYPAGTDYTDYQVRLTINTSGQIYTVLNKFILLISSSGSSGCWCTIDARLQSNFTGDIDTWTVFANKTPISGWSGYNVINTSGLTTYGNTASSQYGQVRFTFGQTGYSTTYTGLQIMKILGFGGVGWTTPSTLAGTGLIYTYDYNKNVFFPAGLRGTQLTSTIATGTAPLVVTSTTKVVNLNADRLDDMQPDTANTGSTIVARDSSGNFSAGTITATLTGNASTATKLASARTITLTGDVSGSGSFDGSGDISITATVADNSHSHTASNVSDFTTAVNNIVEAPTALTSEDLNTCTAFKNYYAGGGNTVVNKPSGVDAFGLTVVKVASGYVMQILHASNGVQKDYFRIYTGGSWTYWYDYYTAYNPQPSVAKLTTARAISLSGDVTGTVNFDGSGDVSITATVVDDSHNHIISNVDGLQTALDDKFAKTAIQFVTGDDLNNFTTPGIYATSSTAIITSLVNKPIAGGECQMKVELTGVAGYLFQTFTIRISGVLHQYLRTYGGSTWGGWKEVTFTDMNVASATKLATARTLTLGGDVSGSATFDGTADKTITVTVTDDSHNHTASTVTNFASTVLATVLTGISTATNAVITATDSVLSALGKLQKQISDNLTTLTNHTGNTSNPHNVTKSQVGLGSVDNTADSAKAVLSATKWATARTITLGGDASGSVSMDGSANVTLTVTVTDDSHNHIIANVDGLQTALDGKASTALATTSTSGLLSSTDKVKIDNIQDSSNQLYLSVRGVRYNG